jgi:hypothetical protein
MLRVCRSAISAAVQRKSHLGRLRYPFVLSGMVGRETVFVGWCVVGMHKGLARQQRAVPKWRLKTSLLGFVFTPDRVCPKMDT